MLWYLSEKLLSREEVLETVDFADMIYNAGKYQFFSPWLSNENLLNLSGGSKAPTLDKIKKALADYKKSSEDIQDFMNFMQKYDMIFARVLKSYSNMLSFDLQIVCTNATMADYNSQEYAEDKQRINKFLNAFDYKAEFQKVMEQVIRNEVGYYTFRKTKWGNKGMKGTLQQLPNDWCLLTGYFERGFLTDYDMNYFIQPGIDIDGYDPEFKKLYQRVFIDNDGMKNYIPTNQFNKRTGTYALWAQTTPDLIWAFKFNSSTFDTTPFLAPYLKSALLDSEIEALQYSKDIAAAYGLLVGEIRLFDNAKSGTQSDQFAIKPSTLTQFMRKVKSGLPDNLKAVAMPTENTKLYQFEDTSDDMYKNHLATSVGTGSSLSRVIYSSDRMSNAELQFATEAQYQIVKPMYYQFANFMEYFANKMTKKFKFKFIFDGCAYEFDRANRFERLMKLADKGIVLNESAWASALGVRPQDFVYSLEESKSSGWVQKLSTMMLNVNTSSYGDTTGRPKVDDNNLSDSGERNRNQ